MLKKNIPEEKIIALMEKDGMAPALLKKPDEIIELEKPVKEEKETTASEEQPSNEGGVKKVKLCELPEYAKYFNMLKKGVPENAVRHAMMRDGKDASFLDKDPNEEIEIKEE